MKQWIHELHFKRFGFVLGEKPLSEALPKAPQPEAEPLWFYGQPYGDDTQNYDDTQTHSREISDDDVPF